MAKTMARLENNIVTNIEWCSDRTKETECLKEAFDYPIEVGDVYSEGRYYRNGEVVLNNMETLQQTTTEYVQALTTLGVKI